MNGVSADDDPSLTQEWTANGSACRKRRREPSWQCEVCQRSFSRIEHLRRHVNGHQMERYYRCDHCKKAFSRSDTLQRHQLTHQVESTLPKARGRCACRVCASAKTKCSGNLPCRRCSLKGIECVYSVPTLASIDSGNTNPLDGQDEHTPDKVPSAADPDLMRQRPSASRTSQSNTPEGQNLYSSSANWLFDPDTPRLLPNSNTLRGSVDVDTTGFLQDLSTTSSKSFEASSHGVMQTCDSTISGRYYIDGDAARLPKIALQPVMRKKSTSSVNFTSTLGWGRQKLSFPQLRRLTHGHSSRSNLLKDDDYLIISRYYTMLCATPSPYYTTFGSPMLPSKDIMNDFIELCLSSFQPLIPILHIPSLELPGQWLLSLTLAATGSIFTEPEGDSSYSYALNEFARRAILASEQTGASEISETTLSQIKLCNCIGMMYDGDESSQNYARLQFHDLAYSARRIIKETPQTDGAEHDINARWKQWIHRESRWRTWYAIWLIDTMWAYQYQTTPLLRLEHATFPLPCQEVLWEADSAIQWQHVFEYSPDSSTLIDAVHSIYVHKRLQPTMGEFSRIILIHGLYHRNWEVGDYFRQPLSAWLPSASRPVPESVPQAQVWLPRSPVFSRWRNATCDCLDILHWSANSVIGAASGLEHPTVLHLHLARVILLTPIRDIRKLAWMLIESASIKTDAKTEEQQELVEKWAIEDAYKARLAMIHAGALLWHIRRYSAKGFYEGSAVFLATLALWAYGKFGIFTPEAKPSDLRDEGEDQESDNNPCPTAINLDRPADDELVQTFIREGRRMQALLNGVGEIRSPDGPRRVLREGLNIIARGHRFVSNFSLVASLRKLEKIESQHTGE